MIEKVGSKYKVVSHTTGRSFGTYPTRARAEERLRQVESYSPSRPASKPPRYRRISSK